MPPWGEAISTYPDAALDLEKRQLRFCNREDIISRGNLIILLKAVRMSGKYKLDFASPNNLNPYGECSSNGKNESPPHKNVTMLSHGTDANSEQSEEAFFRENFPRVKECLPKQLSIELKRHFTLGYAAPIFAGWVKFGLFGLCFPSMNELWSTLDATSIGIRLENLHSQLVQLDQRCVEQQRMMEKTNEDTLFSQVQVGPFSKINMLTEFLIILCTEEAILLVDKSLKQISNYEHSCIMEIINCSIGTIVERETSRFSINDPNKPYHTRQKAFLTSKITDAVKQTFEKLSMSQVRQQTNYKAAVCQGQFPQAQTIQEQVFYGTPAPTPTNYLYGKPTKTYDQPPTQGQRPYANNYSH